MNPNPSGPSNSDGWNVSIEAATPQELMNRLRYEEFIGPHGPLAIVGLGFFGTILAGSIPAGLIGFLVIPFWGFDVAVVLLSIVFVPLVMWIIYLQYSFALVDSHEEDDLVEHVVECAAWLMPLALPEQSARLKSNANAPIWSPKPSWQLSVMASDHQPLTVEFIYEPVTVHPFRPVLTVHLRHHALPDGTLQVPRADTPSAAAQRMVRLAIENLGLKPNTASASRAKTALTWHRKTTALVSSSEQRVDMYHSARLRPRNHLQPLTDTTHPNLLKALLESVGWGVLMIVLGCVAAFALSGVWYSDDTVFNIFFGYTIFVIPSTTAFIGSVFGLACLPRLKPRPIEQPVLPEHRLVLKVHQLRLKEHAQPVTIDLEQPFDVALSRSTTEDGSWVHIDVRTLGASPTDTARVAPQRLRLSVPSKEPPEAMPELEVRGLVLEPEAVTGWLWPTLEHFAHAQGRSLKWRPE